ncbi:TPA: DEAD/DEAH box helicase [Streptococcus equi subsp. zooepidemicus]|nr:DEAD/DEAH box helicase [Streptococcus equi subsp. zooepidemicus]HEL0197543.1 DEAD/DEAH box helicase [Streptococcus equi subsp. zooepidemicus]HEL0207513.1 DEAD/DEAH box helicase [Streptococcus equi subsp. zooepidemicus]HEL0533144.1 DEAD/DEAH box helicase [Streptococcus equi subsp. zooepidemicus]HEL0569315.1 DEAD/DEAH box helicase [Streptococcus equi subsp. zooepidemicus]
MKKLYLESKENRNSLIITGDINTIFSNRRAMRYIKDNLHYVQERESLIIEVDDNLNKTVDRLKKVCEYISAELVYSGNVSEAVNQYALEEEKFSEFAEKARLIRDNHCDHTDFQVFIDSVSKNLKNRSLYELQLLSAYHLAFAQNACNFSVPGAGKTSVVYGAFAYLSNLDKSDKKYVDKLLIISPLSAFGPWELEYEECFGERPSTKRLNGTVSLDDKKQYLYSLDPAKITLLSYASVSSLNEELIYFLRNNKVMVVLDEAHKIKNTSGGITATSVLDIATFCSARVVLTGTPTPNGYEDLYNLYKFIWPTKKVIPFEVYQLKDMSKAEADPRVDTLLQEVEPFFIRVKKSDLGIPVATENEPIIVPMGEIQRRIYDVIEKRYMGEIVSNRDNSFRRDLVKARLIRLMQAATNPNLLTVPLKNFASFEDFDPDVVEEDNSLINDILQYSASEIPAKFIKARELIEDTINNNGKVVVWAIYVKNILDFEAYLQSCGISCRTLYGATPISTGEEDGDTTETREKIITEFHREDSSFNVIIANPFAVSESISLHKVCHNAIYMERSFNAAHFIQSKDRIHRYGLKEGTETNYYYLLSENSVDDVIHNRLIAKETRLREIIESMPIPLFENAELETGDDDIKALITKYVNRTKKM